MGLLALVLMFLPLPAESGGPPGAEVAFDRKAAMVYPAAIGIMSGLVGAGGAFLLMPVLVGVMRIPFRVSIGTSLAITGASALTGFLGKLVTGPGAALADAGRRGRRRRRRDGRRAAQPAGADAAAPGDPRRADRAGDAPRLDRRALPLESEGTASALRLRDRRGALVIAWCRKVLPGLLLAVLVAAVARLVG